MQSTLKDITSDNQTSSFQQKLSQKQYNDANQQADKQVINF